ncbi:hypothetical protein N7528_008818 [Penicillium herquei]|nr:hypothetical protein N7528_008818 [Penicillium herquei]
MNTIATMLHLHLDSLDDDDPWIIEQKNFNILNDFLQPDSTMSSEEAAFQINELTPMKREARGEEDVEHPESYLFEVWCFFIEISKQIPYDHPSQDKLVSLIKDLKSLPSIGVQIWGPREQMLWGDLPLIGAAWAEAWQAPSDSDYEYFDEDSRRDVNWHAFSARLLQSGLTSWYFYAVRILRSALEDEPHRSKGMVEYRIRAAAQWILHSGQAIFDNLDSKFTERELNEMAEGPLYKGKEGLCLERWNFWKASFQAYGGDRSGEVSEETASVCRRVVEMMTETGSITTTTHE